MESPTTGASEDWVTGSAGSSSTSSPDRRGRLMVVSGPSGVGKTSVVNGLASRHAFRFSVSTTTRAPRPGETDGIEYHFVDRVEFERRIAADELLEWAEYGTNLYGTPRSWVEERLRNGDDIVLDIENRGAAQIRSSFPDAVLVFVAPPSLEALEQRLRDRGDTSEEDVQRRLSVAAEQIEEAATLYDHIVVNDNLSDAIGAVVDILAAPLDDSSEETP
ncbi:MAG: guanylate kinase [Acidimicrobiia bacterium]|nr:guanylate kinase [Acidimicrobiia bacterium]NNC74091.1 guanylate kinase [Acidimicrobiia bacterium]